MCRVPRHCRSRNRRVFGCLVVDRRETCHRAGDRRLRRRVPQLPEAGRRNGTCWLSSVGGNRMAKSTLGCLIGLSVAAGSQFGCSGGDSASSHRDAAAERGGSGFGGTSAIHTGGASPGGASNGGTNGDGGTSGNESGGASGSGSGGASGSG